MTFKNAINWFEIPVSDLERATRFYESIFQITLIPMDLPNGLRMRMFPVEDRTTGGIQNKFCSSIETSLSSPHR